MLYKVLWVIVLISHGVCEAFDDNYKETAMSNVMAIVVVIAVFCQIVGIGT